MARLTKNEKRVLIERMLGLRHKIKVHDSMKEPETHEELSTSMSARWELEDEMRAIEIILDDDRQQGVKEKVKRLQDDFSSGRVPFFKKKK